MPTSIPSPVRVVIADPCHVLHAGLIQSIESNMQARVVGTATSADDLMYRLSTTSFDVLVSDLIELAATPVALLRRIRGRYPSVGIVIFSNAVDFAPEMRAAGARAYVAKREPVEQLALAIQVARMAQCYWSPLVQAYLEEHGLAAARVMLSPKELLVLQYVAQDLDNKQIQHRMGVELHTVENYVWTVGKKIRAVGRDEMREWYRRRYESSSTSGSPQPDLRSLGGSAPDAHHRVRDPMPA